MIQLGSQFHPKLQLGADLAIIILFFYFEKKEDGFEK
jgi:hypothetical protein